MKKLQLMKYIAGELVKGKQMVKGRTINIKIKLFIISFY